jgi:hypothetical protein
VQRMESGEVKVMTCGPGRSVAEREGLTGGTIASEGEGDGCVPFRGKAGWAVGRIRSWASLVPRAPFLFSDFFLIFLFLISIFVISFAKFIQINSKKILISSNN